jgi:hypothetical protein
MTETPQRHASLISRLTFQGERATPPWPERVPWEELGPEFFRTWGFPNGEWTPEHLEILGPSGTGKSFFEATILKERARLRGSHIVVVATKPADKTISALGWPVVNRWPPNQWKKDNAQVIYWAKAPSLDAAGVENQRIMVNELLQKLWRPDSNIIIAFDEIAYIEQDLGLRQLITRYYREARALGITIVASTQRPQNVSRYMHSESSWAVVFSPKDEEDAERMAQVIGNRKFYTPVLMDLDRSQREFLMMHVPTRTAYVSHITDTPITTVTRGTEPNEKKDASV